MRVEGSRVAIVGGSIAGCAAAMALDRLGCSVTVLERSSGALRERGSGIVVPGPLCDELRTAGYLPSDYPVYPMNGRRWIVVDGTADGDQRWVQPGPLVTNNWGVLWRALRDALPVSVDYLDGVAVTSVDQRSNGVGLTLDTGESIDVDVAIGADGYRSLMRTIVHPTSAQHFAGYILWRGNFPSARLDDTAAWDDVCDSHEWLSVGFEGGHGVMYPIPDFDGRALRVNWAIYAPTPDGLTITEPTSIPPGAVPPAVYAAYEKLVATQIPPRLQPLFTSPIEELSIQPVYDELVDCYVRGRNAQIGDAATLSRPHTGSGATKALQDARLLETLGSTHTEWETLLAAYDADRTPTGRALVELGRRIGRDQVEHTPPWHRMTPDDFRAWIQGTLDGQRLYFWTADEAH